MSATWVSIMLLRLVVYVLVDRVCMRSVDGNSTVYLYTFYECVWPSEKTSMCGRMFFFWFLNEICCTSLSPLRAVTCIHYAHMRQQVQEQDETKRRDKNENCSLLNHSHHEWLHRLRFNVCNGPHAVISFVCC